MICLKSEIRNPKLEQIETTKGKTLKRCSATQSPAFACVCFGFRYSDFGFSLEPAPVVTSTLARYGKLLSSLEIILQLKYFQTWHGGDSTIIGQKTSYSQPPAQLPLVSHPEG